MSAEKKLDDELDARAFNPRAKGLEKYLDMEERGLIPPTVFHYRTAKGIACGTTEAVFVRDSSFAVTCPACRVVCAKDEAKRAARKKRRR